MSRGSYAVKIKTINGSFDFQVRRYETSAGSSNGLRLCEPGLSVHHESPLLQAFAVRYATCLSYERVAQLVVERSGTTRVSDQRIQQMVQTQAQALTNAQAALIATQAQALATVAAVPVDVYDAQAQEVTWLADGVCVSEPGARQTTQSGQRAHDDRPGAAGKTRWQLPHDHCRDGD